MRKILTAAVLALVGVAFAPHQPVSAIGSGGIDIHAACVNQYPAAWHHEVFVLSNQYNVMGWRCRLNYNTGGYVELNLNAQCKVQYGSGSYARYTDFNDPLSWYCT